MKAPSIRYMYAVRAAPLTSAKCKRCRKSFDYFRCGRHRYFCEPCRELEKKDSNDFYNQRARRDRLHARDNARLAHG